MTPDPAEPASPPGPPIAGRGATLPGVDARSAQDGSPAALDGTPSLEGGQESPWASAETRTEIPPVGGSGQDSGDTGTGTSEGPVPGNRPGSSGSRVPMIVAAV